MPCRQHKITPEQRLEIQRQFKEIDTDSSGALDEVELRVAMKRLGFKDVTNDQVKRLMVEADLDGNGEIDEEEVRCVAAAASRHA